MSAENKHSLPWRITSVEISGDIYTVEVVNARGNHMFSVKLGFIHPNALVSEREGRTLEGYDRAEFILAAVNHFANTNKE